MKKFLAVATALVLAISSLCVFVVADDTTYTSTWSLSTTDYVVDGQDWSVWPFTYVTDSISGLSVTSWTPLFDANSQYDTNASPDFWNAVESGDYVQVVSTGAPVTTLVIQNSDDYSSVNVSGTYTSDNGVYTTYFSCADVVSGLGSSTFYKLYASADGTASLTSFDVVVDDSSSSSSGNSGSGSTVTYGSRLIYVNEEYHALILVRDGRPFFISVPHTVDSDGYCTVCKEYIGTGDEDTTVTINGGEYEAAYTYDVNLAASGWGTADLGDTALIDALATEGSILVITRSQETSIEFGESTYEKFGLVDSWWSGEWIQLGTGGHTDADEESATIIDCISDDGTVVIYDGATVYNEWVSRGMSGAGTVTLVTNTSSVAYKIANVTVYVPAGSTTVEDVDVTEPAEPTDTETEDDGTDDVEVTENDTTADTNPTTGVVLALVPMAIAGFAAVASKRK